jgi:diadenosine tetraphosphate (Ap4A) HIT family hydrolase
VLWRGEGFVLHAVMAPTPISGWLVLTSERHCRAFYALEEREAQALGRWSARFSRQLIERLGAEHVYLFGIGDVLQHCHLHLIPRYAGTPARLRGRGAFDASPEEALPSGVVEEAVRAFAEGGFSS